MSRETSLWGRIFQNIRKSINIMRRDMKPPLRIGEDASGNIYFERQADGASGFKGSRWVENPSLDRMSVPKVPAEWESWLRGRRKEPPAATEIEANRLIMHAKQSNAQALARQRGEDAATAGDKDHDVKSVAAAAPSKNMPFPKRDDYELFPGEAVYKDQLKDGKQ